MNLRHDTELARRLYGRPPDIEAMRAKLPDLGESLRNAAIDLGHDLTLEGIDDFMARLKGAQTSLQHLRIATAWKQSNRTAK